jgi:hypothetical protein
MVLSRVVTQLIRCIEPSQFEPNLVLKIQALLHIPNSKRGTDMVYPSGTRDVTIVAK